MTGTKRHSMKTNKSGKAKSCDKVSNYYIITSTAIINKQDPREQQLQRNLENRSTETYKRSSFLKEGEEQSARNHIGQLSINGITLGRNHLGLQTTA